jgi:UDP-N-acetylenolpyruvoylglucosamine reductase
MKIEEDVLMAGYTTFKTGGPAKLFVTCETVEDVKEAVGRASPPPPNQKKQ